jgi:hypothetical protein
MAPALPIVELLSLSYGRRSIDQFVLVSGSPLGPMTRFYTYPFFSDNCFVALPVGRPLWREDGSVTYRAIADWSGHWGPITIYYRLIWDCSPFKQLVRTSQKKPMTTAAVTPSAIVSTKQWKREPMTAVGSVCSVFAVSFLDYCSTQKMQMICSSETSVDFHKTIWLYIPEDRNSLDDFFRW